MKAFNRPLASVAIFAGLASSLAITSCSLPPREAWHQIQREGLIAFLSNQHLEPAYVASTNRGPAPKGVNLASTKHTAAPDKEQLVGPPSPPASIATPPAPAPTISSAKSEPTAPETPRNIMPALDKPQLAVSVPSLPGFVRSPYTTPPRLIDVKGSSPGATMVCPYTQRPFIIPQDFVNQPPDAALASSSSSTSTPATNKPVPQPPVVTLQNNPPAPSPPANALFNKDKATAPSTPAPTSTPASTASSKTGSNPPANALFNKSSTPPASTAAAKPAVPETPYGMPIPNRPGFVNSPYAAKHQLVDVTGLPVGMEVKCPYTGKLFRVPASDIAEQKAVAAPGTLPTPEKTEKK